MKEVIRTGPVPDKLMYSQESLIRKYLMGQLGVTGVTANVMVTTLLAGWWRN